MQERYTVVSYSPDFIILRHRNEYVNTGFADCASVHVVKETRADGRRKWRRDGSHLNNFYSVLFSRSSWKVFSISTEFRDKRNDGALVPGDKEFQLIADEVTEFFTRMSTTTIDGSEARK
ncbi:hypothetical protein ACLI1M_000834 [Corynebacterium sp. LaCa54]|uniref:hypothetical protein n=1 Tax=Corynebacterium sp. LaCa54 TaxID=3391428 RepID=UPI0039893D31